MILILGYVEQMGSHEFNNVKIYSQIKNVFINVHRNYLVFVEFICKNLTPDQKEKTRDWANCLYNVLQDRPNVKGQYKSNNSEILRRNNELSLNMIKSLCRMRSQSTDFIVASFEILKVFDNVSVRFVRERVRRSLDKL